MSVFIVWNLHGVFYFENEQDSLLALCLTSCQLDLPCAAWHNSLQRLSKIECVICDASEMHHSSSGGVTNTVQNAVWCSRARWDLVLIGDMPSFYDHSMFMETAVGWWLKWVNLKKLWLFHFLNLSWRVSKLMQFVCLFSLKALDYSDDEKEQEAKRKVKNKKKRDNNTSGTHITGDMSGCFEGFTIWTIPL